MAAIIVPVSSCQTHILCLPLVMLGELIVARSFPSGENAMERTPECFGPMSDRSGVALLTSHMTMKEPGPLSAVATTLLSVVTASAVIELQCACSIRIFPLDGE